MLFTAANSVSINNERLAIVLGILTLAAGLAAFFSCRTCVQWLSHLGWKNPTRNGVYGRFYKFHLYYWWSFGVLMVAHLMVAVVHTGLPQAGDPDAPVHWWILGLGLFSAVSAVGVFSSCRVVPHLLSMTRSGNPLSNPGFGSFFKGHSFYWITLGLLAIAHFLTAFSHTGIWPGG